jgi:pimeloyl-ACP methyl ester carboxylesterase
MSETMPPHRRRFLVAATMTVAAAQLGMLRPADAQPAAAATPADLPPIKPGTNTTFPSLKQIGAGLLNVGYAEAGPADGPAVGSCSRHHRSYGCAGHPEANKLPLPPQAELAWWYRYYFATERGRAGYDKYRHDFAKLIWQIASPKWNFDDATFDRSAAAFDNPDHVGIVIHNYRWRLGLAEGESKYDDLEKRLAEGPVITVPSISLEGDANGAPHADGSAYADKFSGKYAHRVISGGIGHNLPQEAPEAFAPAVVVDDGS